MHQKNGWPGYASINEDTIPTPWSDPNR